MITLSNSTVRTPQTLSIIELQYSDCLESFFLLRMKASKALCEQLNTMTIPTVSERNAVKVSPC